MDNISKRGEENNRFFEELRSQFSKDDSFSTSKPTKPRAGGDPFRLGKGTLPIFLSENSEKAAISSMLWYAKIGKGDREAVGKNIPIYFSESKAHQSALVSLLQYEASQKAFPSHDAAFAANDIRYSSSLSNCFLVFDQVPTFWPAFSLKETFVSLEQANKERIAAIQRGAREDQARLLMAKAGTRTLTAMLFGAPLWCVEAPKTGTRLSFLDLKSKNTTPMLAEPMDLIDDLLGKSFPLFGKAKSLDEEAALWRIATMLTALGSFIDKTEGKRFSYVYDEPEEIKRIQELVVIPIPSDEPPSLTDWTITINEEDFGPPPDLSW